MPHNPYKIVSKHLFAKPSVVEIWLSLNRLNVQLNHNLTTEVQLNVLDEVSLDLCFLNLASRYFVQ